MRIYIWNYLEDVTPSYHPDGGVVICTDRDYNEAWRESIVKLQETFGNIREELPEPDRTIKIHKGQEEFVEVFPDTGCC